MEDTTIDYSEISTDTKPKISPIEAVLKIVGFVFSFIFKAPYHILTVLSYSAAIVLSLLYTLFYFVVIYPLVFLISKISTPLAKKIQSGAELIADFLTVDKPGSRMMTSIFKFIFSLVLMLILCYWIYKDGLWGSAMDFIEQIVQKIFDSFG